MKWYVAFSETFFYTIIYYLSIFPMHMHIVTWFWQHFGSFCVRRVMRKCEDPNDTSWWKNKYRIFGTYAWNSNNSGKFECKLTFETRHILITNDSNTVVKHLFLIFWEFSYGSIMCKLLAKKVVGRLQIQNMFKKCWAFFLIRCDQEHAQEKLFVLSVASIQIPRKTQQKRCRNPCEEK